MYDAVIVGGGVVGMSAAYHLAQRGLRLLLLERDSYGSGSTARATGGFRCQFGSPVNVGLSLLSLQALSAFEADTGVNPGYEPVGYLLLAEDDAQLGALSRALELQRGLGEPIARAVGVAEAAALNPEIATGGVLGGSFGAKDGFINPCSLLEGYRRSAARLGVEMAEGVGEVALERSGGRVVGVRSRLGLHYAERVVNAAGAWAADWLSALGVELPVAPLRRQVAVTQPLPGLSPCLPLTVFLGDGFHFRVRDSRLLLLMPGGRDLGQKVDPEWLERVWARACACVPRLAEAALEPTACWTGLYEMSPDHHALLGEWPGLPGLWLANGSSGHGVMHAPALGLLLADLLTEGRTDRLDVAPLWPGRFEAGQFSSETPLF